MLFKNGLVFMENGTFEKVDVRTKDDKIIEVGPSLPANGEEVKDISGKRLIPGLVDIHSHGCGGADFCDGTQEALQTMADTYLKAGDDEKPPDAAVLQHPHGPIQHRFLSQRQQRRRKVEILPPAGRKDHRRPDRLLFLRQGELHLLPGKECSFQHPAPLLR